jgi:hypothetical protein
VSGNEDDLFLSSRRCQVLLQFQAVTSWQPKIENDTARSGIGGPYQKVISGNEGFEWIPGRSKEPPEGLFAPAHRRRQ